MNKIRKKEEEYLRNELIPVAMADPTPVKMKRKVVINSTISALQTSGFAASLVLPKAIFAIFWIIGVAWESLCKLTVRTLDLLPLALALAFHNHNVCYIYKNNSMDH